jgi:hypothetical protein
MFSGHIPVQQMNARAYHLTKGLGGGIHCLCSLIRICNIFVWTLVMAIGHRLQQETTLFFAVVHGFNF